MNDRLREVASGRVRQDGFGGWIGGRARRREYWLWVAPLLTFAIGMDLLGVPGGFLLIGLPMLFAMIRRLHDLGRSGWWAPVINVATNGVSFAVLAFVGAEAGAIVGFLGYLAVLVALGALPGQATTNAYGPPRGKAGELANTFS